MRAITLNLVPEAPAQSNLTFEVGSIALFYGLAADVPAGWAICDGDNGTEDMTNMMVYGASTDGDVNDTGGAASHNHTSGSAQAGGNHSHSFYLSLQTNSASRTVYSGTGTTTLVGAAGHSHTANGSAGGTHTHGSGGNTGSASNFPPYARFYWVQAISGVTGTCSLPNGSTMVWNDIASTIPTGFQICDGTNGTFDIRGRFVYGTDSNDYLGDTSGASSHSHSGGSCGLGGSSHVHSFSGNSGGTSSKNCKSGSGRSIGYFDHTHAISDQLDSAGGSHTHTINGTSTDDSLPPFIRKYYIQKVDDAEESTVVAASTGMIFNWSTDLGNIPEGCQICDGTNGTPDMTDLFVYGASQDSEIGDTGGAETHNHSSASVSSGSHNHSFSVNSSNGSDVNAYSGSGATAVTNGHHHSVSFTAGSADNHGHTVGSTGEASSLPPCLKLFYIMCL